jgi:hypothetical protein
MKKILTVALLLFLGLMLILAAWWWQQQQALPVASKILTVSENPCPAPGVCLATADFAEVRLTLPSKIKVMEEFSLEIAANEKMRAGVLDFAMLGMDMGQHRYRLQVDSNGKLGSAQVMLPVCVSQRSDWQLRMQLMLANGEIWQADFPLLLERW